MQYCVQVLNKEGHGFPADVWALGCVMFALLVGQPPFETSTLKETYSRIAENRFTVPETVSPAAANLIRQLLAARPTARPAVAAIARDPFFQVGEDIMWANNMKILLLLKVSHISDVLSSACRLGRYQAGCLLLPAPARLPPAV